MEAFKIIQTAHNGVLKITVPAHLNNTQLEVIVTPLRNERKSSISLLESIRGYFGTALFPEKNINKHDAYNQ